MNLDRHIKFLLTLFVAWLFFHSISNFLLKNKELANAKPFPDTYYLYFNNTVPYRLNVKTGDTWVLNTKLGSWSKIDGEGSLREK